MAYNIALTQQVALQVLWVVQHMEMQPMPGLHRIPHHGSQLKDMGLMLLRHLATCRSRKHTPSLQTDSVVLEALVVLEAADHLMAAPTETVVKTLETISVIETLVESLLLQVASPPSAWVRWFP